MDSELLGTLGGSTAGLIGAHQLLKAKDAIALQKALRSGLTQVGRPSHLVYTGLAGLAGGVALKAIYDKIQEYKNPYV